MNTKVKATFVATVAAVGFLSAACTPRQIQEAVQRSETVAATSRGEVDLNDPCGSLRVVLSGFPEGATVTIGVGAEPPYSVPAALDATFTTRFPDPDGSFYYAVDVYSNGGTTLFHEAGINPAC